MICILLYYIFTNFISSYCFSFTFYISKQCWLSFFFGYSKLYWEMQFRKTNFVFWADVFMMASKQKRTDKEIISFCLIHDEATRHFASVACSNYKGYRTSSFAYSELHLQMISLYLWLITRDYIILTQASYHVQAYGHTSYDHQS